MNTIEVARENADAPEGVTTGPGRSATGLWGRILAGLKQADWTFSRSATAAALAEHGTREMALDQLHEPDTADEAERDAAPDAGTAPRRRAS